ncbi:MAG: putative DNA-binding domain-containing protein [Pseudomonadota bacterium]|nr:putative DNA-binding domain-containing protein [Pseudomonadota bacterium]
MSDLASMQRAFARDIRTDGADEFGDQPGLKIYRELFFNNVCGFLDSTFPVCREAVGDVTWSDYSRRFFSDHKCSSPLFLEISEEFLGWLAAQSDILRAYPYLAELAHYEWLELAVDVMDVDGWQPSTEVEFSSVAPVEINPASVAACYHHAVHQVSGTNPEVAATLSAFIVYRDSMDKVRFLNCTPLSLMILENLRETPSQTPVEAVKAVMESAGISGEAAVEGGLQVLQDWLRQGVIRMCNSKS